MVLAPNLILFKCLFLLRAKQKTWNANEIIQMLEDDEHYLNADIFLTPPNGGMCSDEDSDGEETASANHLSGPQLSAQAQYRVNYGHAIVDSMLEEEDTLEPDHGVSANNHPRAGADNTMEQFVDPFLLVPQQTEATWDKRDLSTGCFSNPPPKKVFQEYLSPTGIFDLFFDDEVVQYLVDMTNLYAHRDKGRHSFNINRSEMRLFIAILLLSGYNVLPRRKMYWENSDDVENESVSNAMSRNRFEEIISMLHCCDNEQLDPDDKMSKVRPLYNVINQSCLRFYSDLSFVCVDESMIPYYGRHSSKQQIVGKPVRMGYKMWVLAQSNGYVLQFDPYQGAKGKNPTRKSTTSWGLGEKVVVELLCPLPREGTYHVFCDNFFSSVRLFCHLRDQNVKITGTIRSNRLKDCPVIKPKLLEKKPRGYYDQCTDGINRITVVGWNDNKAVFVASNNLGSSPTASVDRYCKDQRKRVKVDQPSLISQYNKKMGGVDRCDQNVSNYRVSMRSKKWWWALFAWVPDMVMQNCWLLYRANKKTEDATLDLLAFRREVVKTYLKKYHQPRSQPGKPSRGRILPANRRISMDVRTDRIDHYQSHLDTQRKCGLCKKNTRKGCKKCGCGLHDHCFEEWHGII